MKFNSQHPTAAVGFRTPNGFFKADAELRCCNCDEPTAWFNVRNKLFYCSDKCYWSYAVASKHLEAKLGPRRQQVS
jgi:hypothetical protein